MPARTTAVFVDDPDDTPPTVTAELEPRAVGGRSGVFIVRAACADDVSSGDDLTLEADVNGVPVEDGDRMILIVDPRRNQVVRLGTVIIMRAPAFTLTVTCTDAAGNTATATDVAVFRR